MTLIGTYHRTIYRDTSNGYTIFVLRGDDDYTCIAYIHPITQGTPLRIHADQQSNGDYICNKIETYSNDPQRSVNYLIDNVDGIGPKTAELIVNYTGADIFTFFIYEENREKIKKELPKIARYVNAITDAVSADATRQSIYYYVCRYGGDWCVAAELYEQYGNRAITELQSSPYVVGRRCGVSMMGCDAIAKDNGKMWVDEYRIIFYVEFALQAYENAGHTCATIAELASYINRIIYNSVWPEEIPIYLIIRAALSSTRFVIEGNYVYRKYTRDAEIQLVQDIKRINNSSKNYTTAKIDDSMYSDKQKRCLELIKTAGIKVITGGPGTGKTTVIKALLNAHRGEAVLCAPTGRAAQRMTEATGRQASTIHRLLNIKPYDDIPDDPQPIDADLIIVDEASMCDSQITALLLSAVKNDSIVIFGGDRDQLPSVGCGNVLHDMIQSGIFPVVELDHVYRQSEDSVISTNAQKIKRGENSLEYTHHFKALKYESDEELQMAVVELAKRYSDAVVLSTIKKKTAGTEPLNNELQSIINPDSAQYVIGKHIYRVGDPVIATRNNYADGYVNGDVGVITAVGEKSITVDFGEDTIEIKNRNIADIQLAYAITIHKSQGSEYNSVIVVLPESAPNMLNRNLLYTAITRAKSNVIIMYTRNALERAIATESVNRRRSFLCDRLTGNTSNRLEVIKSI